MCNWGVYVCVFACARVRVYIWLYSQLKNVSLPLSMFRLHANHAVITKIQVFEGRCHPNLLCSNFKDFGPISFSKKNSLNSFPISFDVANLLHFDSSYGNQWNSADHKNHSPNRNFGRFRVVTNGNTYKIYSVRQKDDWLYRGTISKKAHVLDPGTR